MPTLEKVKWGKDREDAFVSWANIEIRQALSERAPTEQKWTDNIVQWRATLPKDLKDFPWPGASNLDFPLTAIHSDPVYSDFMQILHAPEDYWTPVARRPDRVQHATPMREFLTAVDRKYLQMRRVNQRAILDQVVLGTTVYKLRWLRERKTVRDYLPESGQIGNVTKIRSEPAIEHVPLQDFLIPADAWDIDPDAPVGGARWVAQRFYKTVAQLETDSKGEQPDLPGYDKDAVEKVKRFLVTPSDQLDDKIRDKDDFSPSRMLRIELWEMWSRYDVDGKGIESDIVTVYHVPSMTALRTIHMPYLHGKRPFYATKYLQGFGFYGLGMAEIDEWAQVTATKLVNAIMDNVLLSNTIMLQAPLGSNILPNEPMYPGKVWMTNPNEEVKGIQLGSPRSDIFTILGELLQWAEARTGVSEQRQGDITGLPSRTPAQSLMSILHEGKKRFDKILADVRDVHSEMGLRLFQLMAQMYREDPIRWQKFCETSIGPEDAALVTEVLSDSIDNIDSSFGVNVSATSSMINKDAEKESFISLMQILTQSYGQMFQISTILGQAQPGTPAFETASAAYSAGVELITRLLEKFDIENPSMFLGNMAAVAGQLQQVQQGGQQAMQQMPGQPGQGGLPAPPQSPYPANVANLGPVSTQQLGSATGFPQ